MNFVVVVDDVIVAVRRIRLLQIAQDLHLTIILTVVGEACMAVAATHHNRHFVG